MVSHFRSRLLPFVVPVITFLVSTGCLAGSVKVFFPFQQGQGAEQFVGEFQKLYKGTTITPIFMDANTRDLSGPLSKKPDVYLGFNQYLQEYADIGLFEDLSKFVDKTVIRDVVPAFLEAYTVEGRILGLPLFGNAARLKYNKQAFSQVGLQVPGPNWTWNDFYEACRRLTRDSNGDGINDYYGSTDLWGGINSILYSYGGSIVDKKFTKVQYTEKPAMDAANFIIKLYKEKLIDQSSNYEGGDMKTYPFINGKAGMTFDSGTGLNCDQENKYYKSKGVKFSSSAYFVPKGLKGRVPSVDTWVISIMKTAKNKKEAAKFVNFMMGYKGQCILYNFTKGMPTIKSAFAYKPLVKAVTPPFISYYQKGRSQTIRKGYQNLQGIFYRDVMRISSGEGTMSELLENAKTMAADIIAQSTYSW